MSYEVGDYAKWVQSLCERNYGVKEELDRIFKEIERNKKMEKRALTTLNRK